MMEAPIIDKEAVLVLVHPGSACGSADFNLGTAAAQAARGALITELDEWSGGIVVIDGGLSDEIAVHPSFDRAINACLARARSSGLTANRVAGDDPEQVDRIREFAEGGAGTRAQSFTVSGAWYHSVDGTGCVGSVVVELQRLNRDVTVSPTALDLDAADVEEQAEKSPDRPA